MSIFDAFLKKTSPTPESDKVPPQELSCAPESILSDAIGALRKNAIEITPTPVEKMEAPDVSKLGGKPYPPADFVWSTFQNPEDGITRPLSFFCQINLTQVNTYDADHVLPTRGMLYFFYACDSTGCILEPADRGAAWVFYYENTEDFVPLDPPDDLEEDYVIPEIAIRFRAQNSYPRHEEFLCYSDLPYTWKMYDEILQKFGVDTDEDPENHKMLEYADVIQNEMLSECEE